ncbi:hypothetical protein BDV18DRAFT_157936 [Aspergillus unguis]
MGIVVSEDAHRGRNEQQKVDAIVAENDYGLIMVTLDQISVFLGSWWTTSLTGRIQAFRSYAHVPLTRIISYERASLGVVGFYFAGIPAWAMSTCLSICRNHPLERLISSIQNFFPNDDAASKLVRASFTILHSAARGVLLVLAMQTYMYSLLQTLHLIPPVSMPSLGHFTPLGEFSSMLLPASPQDLSFSSLSSFAFNALKAPSLFYISVYLRPVVELRLYRLIRRQLWKPKVTDDLSIKVAVENDLLDWMVPSLGRRAAEETQRSSLSLMDDIMYELGALRRWITSRISSRPRRASLVSTAGPQQQSVIHHTPHHPEDQPLDLEQQHRRLRSAQLDPNNQPVPVRRSDAHSEGADSGLSNEENHVPDADNMDLLRRARNLTLSTRTSSPDPEARRNEDITEGENRRQSRSDTLLSQSPSPASSQPSPRVRAQLVSDSDVVAMQLELGSRHTNIRNPTTDSTADGQNVGGEAAAHRTATEILDAIISDHGQNSDTVVTYSDDISSMTAAVSSDLGVTATASNTGEQLNSTATDQNPESAVLQPTTSSSVNILPDAVEEPTIDDTTNHISDPQPGQDDDEDAESSIFPHLTDPTARQNSSAGTAIATPSTTSHRVTILSSLPVDSLASHLAALVTTALFAPLESLFLRSLARSYLASRGASAALLSDVYPVGTWGGGSTRFDKIAYMGKMALMFGIQSAVKASVWGIVSGTAIRIGRRWCGWGSL